MQARPAEVQSRAALLQPMVATKQIDVRSLERPEQDEKEDEPAVKVAQAGVTRLGQVEL